MEDCEPSNSDSADPARAAGMAVQEIHRHLEDLVFMVLTVRRSVLPTAQALTAFPLARVIKTLKQGQLITHTSAELAYHFCLHAPNSPHFLDDKHLQGWVLHLLDVYDHSGIRRCIAAMDNVASCALELAASQDGYRLQQVARVLGHFVQRLNGRSLRIQSADQALTDTETLYLPETVSLFPDKRLNYTLYKASATHLWVQTRFGTWRLGVSEVTERFANPDRALRLFHTLETLRLDARIAAGLARRGGTSGPAGRGPAGQRRAAGAGVCRGS